MRLCEYVFVRMCVYVCVYMYVCVCTYMHVSQQKLTQLCLRCSPGSAAGLSEVAHSASSTVRESPLLGGGHFIWPSRERVLE